MKDARPPKVQQLQDGLRLVLADNPSAMTYWGTNTYIIGTGQVAIIDPGPHDPAHLDAILNALSPGETISHIFVTHSHVDHSQLAAPLSQRTGAPVYAYGGPTAGRSKIMQQIAATGLAGGGEGMDQTFSPDVKLRDGQILATDSWQISALWTPGHIGNHMSFAWRDTVFTGDHIMAWASSLVSPPDGDLTDFMASTRKLADLGAHVFHPGHGAAITKPAARCDWLIDHRLAREREILHALSDGAADVAALTARIYSDVEKALIPAARRNVFAHLVDLVQSGRVDPVGELAADAAFELK